MLGANLIIGSLLKYGGSILLAGDCGTDASSRLDQVSLPWTVAIIDRYTEVETQSLALKRTECKSDKGRYCKHKPD